MGLEEKLGTCHSHGQRILGLLCPGIFPVQQIPAPEGSPRLSCWSRRRRHKQGPGVDRTKSGAWLSGGHSLRVTCPSHRDCPRGPGRPPRLRPYQIHTLYPAGSDSNRVPLRPWRWQRRPGRCRPVTRAQARATLAGRCPENEGGPEK